MNSSGWSVYYDTTRAIRGDNRQTLGLSRLENKVNGSRLEIREGPRPTKSRPKVGRRKGEWASKRD
jgi:hypothetical protein